MPQGNLVGLIMATLLEAEPFIESLGLKEVEERPFRYYRKGDIVLVISGIGKANAAMATVYCCQRFAPTVICNLGAAGATRSSFSLGDIYHIDEVSEIDRPRFESEEPRVYLPHVLEGFPVASLATQDHPIIEAEERQTLSHLADLVDMEAASVIQACRRFGVACVVFKFVSDTPDHEEHSQIVEQIEMYRDSLCQFFLNSVAPVLKNISL